MRVRWRDIPGYIGLYQVSTDGRVRRNGHILKPSKNKQGRLGVTLCKYDVKRRYQVHRLVLLAFVGPCPPGMEACHYPDNDPTNNCLDNLRWDTKASNFEDMRIHGTINSRKRKLTLEQIKLIRESPGTQRELAAKFKVSQVTIHLIKSGKTWR